MSDTAFYLPAVLFLLLSIRTVISEENVEGELEILESMDDVRLSWLRDFVRRGKGSVSRLPFDEIFAEDSDSNADGTFLGANPLADENVVKIGGVFDVVADFSKVISVSSTTSSLKMTVKPAMPFSTTTAPPLSPLTSIGTSTAIRVSTGAPDFIRTFGATAEKTQFDFRQLASLLQRIIESRKAKKSSAAKVNAETKRNDSEQNMQFLRGEIDRPPMLEKTFSVTDLKPIELLYKRLKTVQAPGSSQSSSRNSEMKTAEVKRYENRAGAALKKSSRYSHEMSPVVATEHSDTNIDVMARSPEASLPKPRIGGTNEDTMVFIIREGSAVQNGENDYEFMSSITLIIDGRNRILVDTGLATDINGRTWMLQRLSELDVAPPSINYVVTTHGHPDHSGNSNDFPDAYHYAGKFVHRGIHFNFSRIFEDDIDKLTANVYLLKTPGHTSDDISVLVRNTTFFGTVIISGDVFMRKEDIKYPMMWKPLAANETQQEESRRRLLCLAEHIVPGHGPLFRVTNSIKRKLNCPRN